MAKRKKPAAGKRSGRNLAVANEDGDQLPHSVPDGQAGPNSGRADFRDRIKELRRVRAGDLLADPRNWRKHPQAQQDALRGILCEVGYADALLARETADGRLMLIDGHLRAETTPDQMVPVLVADLNEAEAGKLLAVFDPLSAMAEADSVKLDALLKDVSSESEALNEMLGKLADEARPAAEVTQDEVPEPPKVPVTRAGDLWLMGEHRLLCGDSTDGAAVKRLFAGAKASLLFTSPPYGQQRDYGAAKEHIQDWDKLMTGVFQHAESVMESDGQILVNLGLIHRDGEWVPYWDGWIAWMREQGWRRFGWYVWDKMTATFRANDGRLQIGHEWIFHFNRKASRIDEWVPCKHAGETRKGRGQRVANGKVEELHTPGTIKNFKYPDSVIHVQRENNNSDAAVSSHPARFPVGLATFMIKTFPGKLIFEPFSGSGTTIIAAQQLNPFSPVRCYACELDPLYVDIAATRFRNFTGIPAILESTRQTFDEVAAERLGSKTPANQTPANHRPAKKAQRKSRSA